MARSKSSYLNELSTADLKQLLEARQRIDVLEKEKARLVKELGAVDGELSRLVAGVEKPSSTGTAKKAAAPKTAKKKTTKKKTAKKKIARKKVAKKKAPATKKVTGKKVSKKVAARKTTRKVTKKTTKKTVGKAAAQPRLEDIVLDIIKKNGGPVAYQDIMASITKGKLFASRSKNFDNVLRRTLSTSKKVKRAGRGLYDAA
jgi:hypothetical protein